MANLRHQQLRRLYCAKGYTIDDLAEACGCCRNEISLKLGAVRPWTIDDIWRLCDLLQISPINIGHFFPRHGLDRTATPFVSRMPTVQDEAAQRVVESIRDWISVLDV